MRRAIKLILVLWGILIAIGVILNLLMFTGPAPGPEYYVEHILRDSYDKGIMQKVSVNFREQTIFEGGEGTSFYEAARERNVYFHCGSHLCEIIEEEKGYGSKIQITGGGSRTFLTCCREEERKCFVGIETSPEKMRELCAID